MLKLLLKDPLQVLLPNSKTKFRALSQSSTPERWKCIHQELIHKI